VAAWRETPSEENEPREKDNKLPKRKQKVEEASIEVNTDSKLGVKESCW
jgi:hypothetical protein